MDDQNNILAMTNTVKLVSSLYSSSFLHRSSEEGQPATLLRLNRIMHGFCKCHYIVVVAAVTMVWDHAVALSVGDQTMCAIESDTGRLRCWGKPQASVSPSTNAYYPEKGDLKVPGSLLANVVDVSVLDDHICALLGVDSNSYEGKLVCFEAGDESKTSLPFIGPSANEPVLESKNFVQLSGKGKHVCALDAPGSLFCWSAGNGGDDQDMSTWTGGSSFTAAATASFSSVSVGYDHMCAIGRCDESWKCFGPASIMTIDGASGSEAKIPAFYNPSDSTHIFDTEELVSITCGKGVSSFLC